MSYRENNDNNRQFCNSSLRQQQFLFKVNQITKSVKYQTRDRNSWTRDGASTTVWMPAVLLFHDFFCVGLQAIFIEIDSWNMNFYIKFKHWVEKNQMASLEIKHENLLVFYFHFIFFCLKWIETEYKKLSNHIYSMEHKIMVNKK